MTSFYNIGYFDNRLPYRMKAIVIEAAIDNRVKLITNAEPGQNGFGIIFMSKGKIYCVGIYTSDKDGTQGTLISEELSEIIKKNKFSSIQ